MTEQGRKSRSNGSRPAPRDAARRASAELAELLGREPEGIVSMERTDDGWRIGVEVIEVHRIPDTADLLAEYEVDARPGGQLTGYRRVRRYARGKADGD